MEICSDVTLGKDGSDAISQSFNSSRLTNCASAFGLNIVDDSLKLTNILFFCFAKKKNTIRTQEKKEKKVATTLLTRQSFVCFLRCLKIHAHKLSRQSSDKQINRREKKLRMLRAGGSGSGQRYSSKRQRVDRPARHFFGCEFS